MTWPVVTKSELYARILELEQRLAALEAHVAQLGRNP